MAAVSESLRAMAREALLHAGGRGFMRFAPSGGALLITDAPRHCGEEADRRRLCGALRAAGSCALLGTAVVFHGVYNLLASYGGRAQYVAYALPLLLLAAAFAARQLYAGRAKSE